MKYIKRTLCAVLAAMVAFCAFPAQEAGAATLAELQKKREALSSSTEAAKKEIENLKSKKLSLEEEMDALDKVLNSIQTELDAAQEDLDFLTAKLEAAEEELQIATEKREAQFELLGSRMKFLQQKGSSGYLEILLEAENFSDLFLRMQYVNDIMIFDKEILDELQEIQDTIQKKKDEIEESHAAQEEVVALQQAKFDEMNEIVSEKEAVYASYESSLQKYEQLVKANEQLEADVLRQMTQMSSGSSTVYYSGNGQFAWPVPGYSRISSEYGYRTSPISGKREFHNGLDIPGGYGTAIVAAEAGKVTYAAWMNGYGYTIIIDHGGGLTTLYGHNSSLVVSKGDVVKRGQTIAKCGSTGWSTGNHCHFTVSKNGSYVNPHDYL